MKLKEWFKESENNVQAILFEDDQMKIYFNGTKSRIALNSDVIEIRQLNNGETYGAVIRRSINLSETEKNILENTPKEYKYIIRNKNGDLWITEKEPYKSIFCEAWKSGGWIFPFDEFNNMFKDIRWKVEEPLQFRNDQGEFIL